MMLSRRPCKIIGVRLGEASINLITSPKLNAKFILLGNSEFGDNLHAGAYSKTSWSEETIAALGRFIECAERDALADLFDDQGQELQAEETKPADALSFPQLPTLGGPKRGGA